MGKDIRRHVRSSRSMNPGIKKVVGDERKGGR